MTSEQPAPMSIGKVTLTVHDLDSVSAFYQKALGLQRLSGAADHAVLGVGGAALLELRADKAARRSSPREAGLFHTAFLLPARADLGRWLKHAAASGISLQGASDHLVSEALYLADPEGNGIEIYRDRPRADWPRKGGAIAMATERLDIDDVISSAGASAWGGYPEGGIVGHVHLQVGALPEAEAFYISTLGFEPTAHYPGAAFYSTGGYHHHLATNIWNSRGAAARAGPSTGLTDVGILASSQAVIDAVRARAAPGQAGGGALTVRDPWGTGLTLSVA